MEFNLKSNPVVKAKGPGKNLRADTPISGKNTSVADCTNFAQAYAEKIVNKMLN
jgi:hypothetical protein